MAIRRYICSILLVIGILGACSDDRISNVTEPEPPLQFIDSVYPADNAVDVPLNCNITVSFLRPMDTASMTAGKFFLSGGLMYSFYRDKTKAVFWPAAELQPFCEYTVRIDSGIADEQGNVMRRPLAFSFRTVSGNALISSVSPLNGQTDVPLTTAITVAFTEDMDSTTINPSTVFLSDVAAGTVSYANKTLQLISSDSLMSNHTYTVTLKGEIATAGGVPLGQDVTWSFTTVDISTPFVVNEYPVDGSEGVLLDTHIWFLYSDSVDSSSVTSDEFSLSGGATGSIRVSYRTVFFELDEDLQPDSQYTVTFDGSIADMDGHEYYVYHSWSFRTRRQLTGEIESVIPDAGFPYAGPDANISITFTDQIARGCVSAGEFIVSGDEVVEGVISYADRTVIFNPTHDLVNNSTYTATFNGDIIGIYGGTAQVNFSWTFTVNTFDLVAWSPDADCVPLDGNLEMNFSHPVDPATVTTENIIVREIGLAPIAGSLSCDGSVVVFHPDAPFTPLTRYRIEVLSGLQDIFGSALGTTRIKDFSTRGENLLPLSIGNKWVYYVTTRGYTTAPSSYLDSILIVRDSIIDDQHVYYDQRGRRYRYEDEIIQTTFYLIMNPYSGITTFDNNDCDNGSISTIETDLGSFTCQHFQFSSTGYPPFVESGYNFAPGVGLVAKYMHVNYGSSGSDEYTDVELIRYELQ